MTARPTYLPQLDGLRAFAVTAVLVHHFWSGSALGPIGVRLFFVISGYLITGILLRARDSVGDRRSIGPAFGRFYARRTLRIWPIYYAVLLAAWLYGAGDIRDTIVWHATFTSNLLFAWRDGWGKYFAHLWSLGVEEQFYFVWPFLILLLPRRWLLPAVISLIVGGVAFRFGLSFAGYGSIAIYVLTPTQFDVLGAGALLAILEHRGVSVPSAPAHAIAAITAVLAWLLLRSWPAEYSAAHEALFLTMSIAPLAWLVMMARDDRPGVMRLLLANPVALYLGRISYGVYLYHLFVKAAVDMAFERANRTPLPDGPEHLVLCASVTVAVAALSWHFFEAPILELKRLFRDRPPDARLAEPAPGATSAR